MNSGLYRGTMSVGLEETSSARRRKKCYDIGYHQAQNKMHFKIGRIGVGQEHK